MLSASDSFAIVSSTDRASRNSNSQENGGLFLLDLKSNNFKPIPLTFDFDPPSALPGISFFKRYSSFLVVAINHTLAGHSIIVFEVKDK